MRHSQETSAFTPRQPAGTARLVDLEGAVEITGLPAEMILIMAQQGRLETRWQKVLVGGRWRWRRSYLRAQLEFRVGCRGADAPTDPPNKKKPAKMGSTIPPAFMRKANATIPHCRRG